MIGYYNLYLIVIYYSIITIRWDQTFGKCHCYKISNKIYIQLRIVQYFGKISSECEFSTSLKKLYTFIKISASRPAMALLRIKLLKYELPLLVVSSPHQRALIMGFWKNLIKLGLLGLRLNMVCKSYTNSPISWSPLMVLGPFLQHVSSSKMP